jgi:hypothetical protein
MKGKPILLIRKHTIGTYIFRLPFPSGIETEDVTNYEKPDVIGGTKPVSYANEEPQKIELKEVLFDSTDNPRGDIRGQLEELRSLMKRGEVRDPASGITFNADPSHY